MSTTGDTHNEVTSTATPSATTTTNAVPAVDSLFAQQLNALSVPQLVHEFDQFDWTTFLSRASLDELDRVGGVMDKIRDKIEATTKTKCKSMQKVPRATKRLIDRVVAPGNTSFQQCVEETVPYVLKILPRAHIDRTLKHTIRQILGANTFTLNLSFTEQWTPFIEGCRNRLRRIGEPLERFFEQEQLAAKLGNYAPNVPHSAPPIVMATTATAATITATTGDASGDYNKYDGLAQQFVPPQCAPTQFSRIYSKNNEELECVYIHFLILLAIALNNAFQHAVRTQLKTDNIVASVYSGGTKSYERMYVKMLSMDDHGDLPKPRPSYNLDVVRCLVTFDDADTMRQGFDSVSKVFVGGYEKFKNGMAWTKATAASRYYLRLVLGTGRFEFAGRRTLGSLRSDPRVKELWRNYLWTTTVPPFVTVEQWQRQARSALKWLEQLDGNTPIFMHCEVQMLLRRYRDVRRTMHELYKAARAPTQDALHHDFCRYPLMLEAEQHHIKAGDNDLTIACRDGIAAALPGLLMKNPSAAVVGRGIVVAARYGRKGCVKILTSDGKRSRCTISAQHLTAALKAVAEGTEERNLKTLSDMVNHCDQRGKSRRSVVEREDLLRRDIAKILLKCGAEVNGTAGGSWIPLMWASKRGFSHLVKLLIDKRADVTRTLPDGATALHLARHRSVVGHLVRAKADLMARTNMGDPALLLAAQVAPVSCVQALLDSKSDIGQTRPDGTSALHMAAQQGRNAVVRVLIDSKATVDQRKNTTDSPLAIAIHNGQIAVVEMLVDAGANVNDVYKGKSAVAYAKQWKQKHVIEALRRLATTPTVKMR